MQVTQCKNGHFFDLEKYQVCPHCGASVDVDYKKGNKNANGTPKSRSTSSSSRNNHPFFDDEETEMIPEAINTRDYEVGETEYTGFDPVYNTTSLGNSSESHNYSSAVNSSQNDEFARESEKKHSNNVNKSTPAYSATVSSPFSSEKLPANNSGKTIGFFSSSVNAPREPVVGWLVCVKGEHFGECFEIFSGKNSLGRDNNNKIVIPKDYTVSGSKHLWITYEPKKREFYVQPGEASGLAYLNDENIMTAQKMSAYDRLEIGSGNYILVPLCCDRFSWEDYIG